MAGWQRVCAGRSGFADLCADFAQGTRIRAFLTNGTLHEIMIDDEY
jgi:hypothetical protein